MANRYYLATSPASVSVECMHYTMLALIAFSIGIIVFKLLRPLDKTIAYIFYPIAIVMIVTQIAVAFLQGSSVVTASLIDVSGYVFDLLVWSMCAYLAYQSDGQPIAFMCYGTIALSLGLAPGAVVSLVLLSLHITQNTFVIVNLLFAFCAIGVTVLVFPERRLEEMLQPLENLAPEDPGVDLKQQRRAYFMEACEAVAAEGELSARETEVLKALAKKMSAQEIADELVISINTVRAHTRNIHRKLDVNSTADIVKLVNEHIQQ